MNREWMEIIENTPIAKDTYRLVVKGEMATEVVEPGQFVHIQVSNEFFLRRPVSIADQNSEERVLALIYKVMGQGTDALTCKSEGQFLDVLGPGGQGYPLTHITTDHALLVGGGVGVPPLYYLAKKLWKLGVQVTCVLGFRSKEEIFLEQEFRELGDVYITTNDGSLGTEGFVTDVIPSVQGTADTYFSCGPTVMLKAVSEQLNDLPGYISLEERMGCGVGACFACVVKTPESNTKGYQKICSDGPVFKAEEVVL